MFKMLKAKVFKALSIKKKKKKLVPVNIGLAIGAKKKRKQQLEKVNKQLSK